MTSLALRCTKTGPSANDPTPPECPGSRLERSARSASSALGATPQQSQRAHFLEKMLDVPNPGMRTVLIQSTAATTNRFHESLSSTVGSRTPAKPDRTPMLSSRVRILRLVAIAATLTLTGCAPTSAPDSKTGADVDASSPTTTGIGSATGEESAVAESPSLETAQEWCDFVFKDFDSAGIAASAGFPLDADRVEMTGDMALGPYGPTIACTGAGIIFNRVESPDQGTFDAYHEKTANLDAIEDPFDVQEEIPGFTSTLKYLARGATSLSIGNDEDLGQFTLVYLILGGDVPLEDMKAGFLKAAHAAKDTPLPLMGD